MIIFDKATNVGSATLIPNYTGDINGSFQVEGTGSFTIKIYAKQDGDAENWLQIGLMTSTSGTPTVTEITASGIYIPIINYRNLKIEIASVSGNVSVFWSTTLYAGGLAYEN